MSTIKDNDCENMTPEEMASIVADLMPISGGGKRGEALRRYVRAFEAVKDRQIGEVRQELAEATAEIARYAAQVADIDAQLGRDADQLQDHIGATMSLKDMKHPLVAKGDAAEAVIAAAREAMNWVTPRVSSEIDAFNRLGLALKRYDSIIVPLT
jgi:hypothetical protein